MCSRPYEGIVRIASRPWATHADRETHDPCRVNALALAANEIFAAGEPAEAEPLHEALWRCRQFSTVPRFDISDGDGRSGRVPRRDRSFRGGAVAVGSPRCEAGGGDGVA